MSGSADEFCVVEPLTLADDDLVQHSGISRGIEGIAFGEKEQSGAFVCCLQPRSSVAATRGVYWQHKYQRNFCGEFRARIASRLVNVPLSLQ